MSHGGARRLSVVAVAAASLAVLAGCGGSPSSSAATPAPTTAPSTGPSTTGTGAPTTSAPPTTATPSTVKSDAGKGKFCADAQVLADENTQSAKDLAVPGNATSPTYRSKYAETMLPILLNLATDAPSDIAATAKEYDGAYTEYVRVLNEVGFKIPPPDEAGRKLVEAATLAYGKIAVPDLKTLDTYVTSTCGFNLNLATTG